MQTKTALVSLLLVAVAASVSAQGGSGAPSSDGQAVTPAGAASADAAVQKRHDKAVARANARAAKRAAKKASAASSM